VEPNPPTVVNPQGALIVHGREPLPVPAVDGGWPLLLPEHGVIGADRRIVRVGQDGQTAWSLTLPVHYALDSGGGGRHAPFVGADGSVLVIPATAGTGTDSTHVLVVHLETGERLWEAPLPAPPPGGSTWLTGAGSPPEPVLVVAQCGGHGCELTAMDAWSGAPRWSTRVPGAEWVAADSRSGADSPVIVAGGSGQLWTVDPYDGVRHGSWQAPAGPVGHVIETLYRLVLVTAPADSSCSATASGYDLTEEGAPPVWTVRFRWDDPRATPDRHGCRYDPSQRLMWRFELVLPDVDGALVVDDYHGTRDRRPPGEYQVAPDRLVWDGHQYRDRGNDSRALPVPAPQDGPPWAIEVAIGSWVVGSGDGATLIQGWAGQPLWHQPGAVAALKLGQARLAFLTRTEVIVVGPEAPVPPGEPTG
jgi:hypothetical protein